MAKYTEPEKNTTINLIGEGTDIQGDITSSGDIRIDGSLKGNLNTKGKVVIGATGKVVGEITCKNSEVLGSIEGKIHVAELLSLKPTAKIVGDLTTKKLSIDPGSTFTGNCKMSEQIFTNGKSGTGFGQKEKGI